VKLQSYTADTLTLNCERSEFYITEGPWRGQYMHDLYRDAYMPWEWHEPLQQVAREEGITLFSAPFDFSAVDLLEDLHMPAYKIASPELIDLELIERVGRTGKPIIISTGGGTLGEINAAIAAVHGTGNRNLCLMKCTSSYPAPLEDMNLNTIPHLQSIYGGPVGLSDHSMGITAPVVATSLGVNMIEKHFVLDKSDETVDSFFSLDPSEFSEMVSAVRQAEACLGSVEYTLESNPKRRSLYASQDIAAGQRLTRDNLRNVRPGVGLPPRHLKSIIGRRAKRDFQRGEPIFWDMID
ncbi:MAG: pseudaminic acid synthase, partial [Pseudomonadota bacterium]|nr:pseudaminic acid synthase [Pseudomonadota bacterium]